MRRLILLPEKPGNKSGYQKAVTADVEKLNPDTKDTVIYYTSDLSGQKSSTYIYINRPAKFSVRRIFNLLALHVSNELQSLAIQPHIQNKSYDYIFCGEVTLYRALRKSFPEAQLHVRFHNFFSVVAYRNTFLQYKLPLLTRLNFFLLKRLEKQILSDNKVIPIFITPEEFNFFRMVYPIRQAAYWPVLSAANQNKQLKRSHKPVLVWFGGLSVHKKYSVAYFIKNVFTKILAQLPEAEFHLFGNGTQKWNNESMHIFGHGFYTQEGLPFAGEALFINPDLLGGGIKLKVNDLLKAGVPFISTPFGVEGYQLQAHPNIIIEEIDNWASCIIAYFHNPSLVDNN